MPARMSVTPIRLPRPDDALGRKDPLGGHAGSYQGQPGAKPGQVRPFVREFGLRIGPAPFAPHRHSPQNLVVSDRTDMPLPEERYLLHVSPEDGSPTAAWPL